VRSLAERGRVFGDVDSGVTAYGRLSRSRVAEVLLADGSRRVPPVACGIGPGGGSVVA
jgi:hypothetical protein